MSLPARLLRAMVFLYRWTLSPLLGPRCRFLPSCSEYALDALARHGALAGGWLTLRRLARCHPWGGSGYDPVPPADRCRCHNFAPSPGHTAPDAVTFVPVTVPGTSEAP